ncbi:hypothetical protein BG004_007156, partial [Podila humilis]
MEITQSGLATPPIVSPRPVQNHTKEQQHSHYTHQPLSVDESWKAVGSPPRRPLLSPPSEQEREMEREEHDELLRPGSLSPDSTKTTPAPNAAVPAPVSSSLARATSLSTSTAPSAASLDCSPHGLEPQLEFGPLSLGSLSTLHIKSSSTGTPGSQYSNNNSHQISSHRHSLGANANETINNFLFDSPASPTYRSSNSSRHLLGFDSHSEGSVAPLQRQSNSLHHHHNYVNSSNNVPDWTRPSNLQRPDNRDNQTSPDPMPMQQHLWDSDTLDGIGKKTNNYSSNSHSNMSGTGVTSNSTNTSPTDSMSNFLHEGSLAFNHRATTPSKYPPPLDTSSARISDTMLSGGFRGGRSLSFSESSFSSVVGDTEGGKMGGATNTGIRSAGPIPKSIFSPDDDTAALMDMRTYKISLLPMMEEEAEESAAELQRASRARSFSTSAAFGLSAFASGLSSPTGLVSYSSSTFGPLEESGPSRYDDDASTPFGPHVSENSSSIMNNSSNMNSNISNNDNSSNNMNSGPQARPFLHRKLSGGLPAWSTPTIAGNDVQSANHRRSMTIHTSGYGGAGPLWEMSSVFQPLQSPVEQDRMDRHRVARRFSLAPSMPISSQTLTFPQFYDHSSFADTNNGSHESFGALGYNSGFSTMDGLHRHPFDNDGHGQSAQRRHSVAGSSGAYLRSNNSGSFVSNNNSITNNNIHGLPLLSTLTSSLESLHLDGNGNFNSHHGEMDKLSNSWNEYYEPDDFQGGGGGGGSGYDYHSMISSGNSVGTNSGGRRRVSSAGVSDLGKGLTLGQVPQHGTFYVVEFKAGRNDLFYKTGNNSVNGGDGAGSSLPLKCGDLVIVEADRGKDLGKIANDSITPQQIKALQAQQAEIAAFAAQQDMSSMGTGGMA